MKTFPRVSGEKGRRIRELTSVVQKRFKFPEGTVELYAEKVANRGLCAVAQAESLRYKLLGGLAVRRFVPASCQQWETSTLRGSQSGSFSLCCELVPAQSGKHSLPLGSGNSLRPQGLTAAPRVIPPPSRSACYGVLRFVMESGAKGCEVIVSGKLRAQRAKSMKFKDGYMVRPARPLQPGASTSSSAVCLRHSSVPSQAPAADHVPSTPSYRCRPGSR